MTYIPHSEAGIAIMLAEIGVDSIEDLFKQAIPERYLGANPELPPAISEQELLEQLAVTARDQNRLPDNADCFIGAGAYRHYVPAFVDQLLLRSEFYTAYTPYQPEISQGTLASIFEYQTLMCILTGMDVANGSTYDCGSATAEAALMASRLKRNRSGIAVAASINPDYRRILKTYHYANPGLVTDIGFDEKGRLDLSHLKRNLEVQPAAVIVGYPNYFGVIENLGEIAEMVHEADSLLVAVVAEPLSLAMLKPPGQLGADIVVGEGQSFGNPVSFGGPALGIFATRKEFVRQLPGRVVGKTEDAQGNVGYCLTLSTREQHIRRDKATSNICSNENLCALAAVIYLAGLGRDGLADLARLNLSKAVSLKRQLCKIDKIEPLFDSPHFNEFAVRLPVEASRFVSAMAERGIAAGISLGVDYEEFANGLLVCTTEFNSEGSIAKYVETAAEVVKELA